MKIELKHLVPYLPYGICFYHFDPEREKISVCKIANIGIDEATIINRDYEYYEKISDLRPLLLPLRKMVDDIVFHILKIEPFKFNGLYEDAYKWIFDVILKCQYNLIPMYLAEFIYSRHGDLFGLVDSGLAIDKSLTPYTKQLEG
jgi:hypothetical protein